MPKQILTWTITTTTAATTLSPLSPPSTATTIATIFSGDLEEKIELKQPKDRMRVVSTQTDIDRRPDILCMKTYWEFTHSICLSLCRNVCLCCSTSSLVLKYVHLKVSNNKQQTTFCILYLFNLNPIWLFSIHSFHAFLWTDFQLSMRPFVKILRLYIYLSSIFVYL